MNVCELHRVDGVIECVLFADDSIDLACIYLCLSSFLTFNEAAVLHGTSKKLYARPARPSLT